MSPFFFANLAWQASLVFTARSLRLWADPGQAQARLTEHAMEKQRAFLEGMAAATRAGMAGASPQAVAAAALRPARRRLAANHRALKAGR